MTSRKAASGRNRLVEAAGRLFAAAGFEGVSTKQLAAEAGLSIGALYHHFPGKHAAYCAALEWGVSRMAPADAALFDSASVPRQQLEGLVAWFCAAISGPGIESQLLRLELLDPHLDRRLSDLAPFSTAFGRFQDLMGQVAPQADAEQAVAAIVALSFGFVRLGGLKQEAPGFSARMRDPDEIAAAVIGIVLPPHD